MRSDVEAAIPDIHSSEYEEEILRSLRRIIRAVDLYSRKLMAEHGLSGPQLLCLKQLDARGELLSGELAKGMSLSPATVTGILDRLEGRGLVTRERRAEDKRTVLVRLTPAGRKLVEQAPSPLQDDFLFKLRALPERRQAGICRTLKTLVTMMSAEDIDAAPLLASGEAVGPRPIGRGRRAAARPMHRETSSAGNTREGTSRRKSMEEG
ncbi:MAG: MarR family transcriptional regulator [Gammaproteobacteria bacterium]|nr:MarR family transcriptional regulator [Gammaproteobacteria bacterium]